MKGNSSNMRFVPSKKGFNDFRNEGFVQKVCLKVAQKVAGIAGGASGKAFDCDVRPGKTRCHARARCYIHGAIDKREWYDGAYSDIADAAASAAESVGGTRTWKRKR